jgi:4-amino-4-deoxy-L-arabinose transferase-like glycosyltransferase
MRADDARLTRTMWLIVLALVAIRLVAAAYTPLAFDEAYYWTWSQHLAGGYLDHPPMVALVIRLGTVVAGDTEFGVRLVSILLALPMSWAVYRTTAILFGSRHMAATAAILLNVTLMAAVGTMIVTPDAPLMVASSFVLYTLAKMAETGRGAWWLGVGVAVGLALLSKYNALFFGPAILIWLIAVPKLRRWLVSPWPYLGGIVAFALAAPVIVWNAEHHWVSFAKQFGRARIAHFTLRYIAEVVPTQFLFATPLVFILGAMGLHAMTKREGGPPASRAMINAFVWTTLAYFAWHALHDRVEANWLAPIYPAFAIAAAVAADGFVWSARAQRTAEFCCRWALPSGVAMFVLLVVQVDTGVLSGYRRDASVRKIGVGWPAAAHEIEAIRARTGATCVLASNYGIAAWLMFYLPKGACVAQRNERIRWINMPEPDAAHLRGKLLLVEEGSTPEDPSLKRSFERVETVADVPRTRGPLVAETYRVQLLDGAKGDVLESPTAHARPPKT